MLREEARWFQQQIAALDPTRVYPMLDIGSSTKAVRTLEQPWIETSLFKPARDKGYTVKHVDIKDAPGVDIVGDVSDVSFLHSLSSEGFRSVLCTNVLYCFTNREAVCRGLVELLPIGGYLFVSCPYRYPLIPEPLDTNYRPNTAELAKIFPNTKVLATTTVRAQLSFASKCRRLRRYFANSRYQRLKFAIRMLLPFYRPREWLQTITDFSWALKTWKVSCVVLQRYEPTQQGKKITSIYGERDAVPTAEVAAR